MSILPSQSCLPLLACVFVVLFSATAPGRAVPAATTSSSAPEQPVDYRFRVETLVEGMPQPMQLALAPDGRIFFIEIGGKLRIYDPKTRQTVEAGVLKVTTAQENGLLGMVLDPRFAENGWIYLFRSLPDEVFKGQVLSRFTMRGDQLDLASEQELLRVEEQRRECCHHAGALRFGPDGLLYVSTGDNTNPHSDSKGYAPIDERPDRGPWDAQKSAANTHDLRGKILRIRPLAEGGYAIPDGNLFAKDGSQGRPEIYVMGCRNPWRYDIDPATNILYFGDVGPDAGSDGPRGPRGHDEINQVRQAGNFGWPHFVGKNLAYHWVDFATEQIGAAFDPQRPENRSPNNTGARILPPAQPAWIAYPGSKTTEYPTLGSGGRTACGGPVYHYRPEYEKTGGFPRHFDRSLLIYDWSRPFMKWVRLGANSELQAVEDFTSAVQIRRAVDMAFGPDGCLYALDYGETWGANKDSRLLKISYQYGNLAPVATARATGGAGREPLTVALSGEGSMDHEGDPLTYEWRLLPEGRVFAATREASLTIAEPGNYRAELRVRDDKGASSTSVVPLIVGNAPPRVSFLAPRPGDFFSPGKPVPYRLAIEDPEDGNSEAQPDELGVRALVSAEWQTIDGRTVETEQGLALMKQSDCFNCHAVEQKLVGPSLIEIAQRYRGQPAAMEPAVKRVLHGSTGVWGPVPMLPHAQHTEDEVQIMVRWIFGLEMGKGAPSMTRGIAGEFAAPKDPKISGLLLQATYSDAGRGPAGSLAASAALKLRSRRIEATENDGQHGPRTLNAGGCTGKSCLGAIDHGHRVRFTGLNLEGVDNFKVRVSSGNAGGRIELRSGTPDGPLLGSLEVAPTGGWDRWAELTGGLAPAQRTDVYVLFINPGKTGLMNLDWIEFPVK